MEGRGSCLADALRKLTAQQELRPPEIGRFDDLLKIATAPRQSEFCRHAGQAARIRDMLRTRRISIGIESSSGERGMSIP